MKYIFSLFSVVGIWKTNLFSDISHIPHAVSFPVNPSYEFSTDMKAILSIFTRIV